MIYITVYNNIIRTSYIIKYQNERIKAKIKNKLYVNYLTYIIASKFNNY